MHQAIAFAIASEFCRKLPFVRNFRSEDEISAFHSQKHSHSLANSFATLNSQLFVCDLVGLNSPANFQGASEFAFAFVAVSLRPRCTQTRTDMITNENQEILLCFRFCNGKANKFRQSFFRICFRNGHVGHAQATTTGHTYEYK